MAVENGMPEQDDVRRKAVLRLAIAGIITASALAVLWWLDQGGSGRKEAAPTKPAPSPIVAAPAVPSAPPADELEETPAEAPSDTGDEGVEPPSPTEMPDTPSQPMREPPPPPRVSNQPPARSGVAPAPAMPSTPRAARAAPEPTTTAAPPSAPIAPPRAPSASNGFAVQLGVFSNPDNARELVDRLNRQGIRAYMETRVQIGPFLNRAEAEKAQAEMRKLGLNALVVTP